MKLNSMTLAVCACLAAAGSAQAQVEAPNPSATISGFGTLAVTKTNTDLAVFSPAGIPTGAKTEPTLRADSKLGLQFNGKYDSLLSATAQVLAKDNGNGEFKPEVEWAFAKIQALPSLAFRVGRVGAPLFAVSDYRDVNYANLWVRPPFDVYSQVPISHLDGGDVIYQTTLGSTTLTGQAFFGEGRSIYTGVHVDANHLAGVNFTAEFDSGITVRLGTAQARLNVHNASIMGLITTLAKTPFAAVGRSIDPKNGKSSFSGLGVSLDRDDWVANAEYTIRRTSNYLPDSTGWEVTLGRRVGQWTPFVMLSQVKVDDRNVVNSIPKVGAQLTALSSAVDAVLDSQYRVEKTQSLGVRWDFRKNMAVKGQFDHITPDHSRGMFNSAQAGFGTQSVNAIALSLDFVF